MKSQILNRMPKWSLRLKYVFIPLVLAGFLFGCATTEEPLPNPDAAFGDRAGFSVAISGDALISGARWSDLVIDEAGKALAYRFDGTAWELEATLLPENDPTQAQGGLFGERVDLDADRAIVGAPHEVNGFIHSGATYIFEWNGSRWNQIVRLISGDPTTEGFGNAVAISGDYAAVGTPRQPDLPGLAYGPGSVYIFRREPETGRWSRDTILRASDGNNGDEFGYSVSLDGDVLVVGAPLDDDLGENTGSAYLFRRRGSEWVQTQKLSASGLGIPEPLFGTSVSVSGDLAIVGAEGDLQGADPQNQGAAYVFLRAADTWYPNGKLVAFDGDAGHQFGHSVSVDDEALVVGAWLADGVASTTGAAYVYKRSAISGTWVLAVKLIAEDGGYGDAFGASVDISNDCAAVGAPNWEEPPGPDFVGATYVFCDLPGIGEPDIDVVVVCCEQPPDPGGAVDFTLRYTGRGDRRPILTRWVEVRAPDGQVETILHPDIVVAPLGEALEERGVASFGRDAFPGTYRLTVYWKDESGLVQARSQTFQR